MCDCDRLQDSQEGINKTVRWDGEFYFLLYDTVKLDACHYMLVKTHTISEL